MHGAIAQAESRIALLIGNSAYRSSPLANPVNDVRLMEGALKESGFAVTKAENASIREMRRLVRDFGEKLKASGGVGLFYFAGHGVQVRGENFLVSTDSDIRNEDEVADDSINANVILEKMQSAGNRMNLIVLDACRNNPFANKSRSAVAGLATMNAPSGSLVAYSTAPGSVASDGTGKNGLYTEHLAKVIRQPGLPVEEVFKQVRSAVRRDSNNQQTPWENTALEGQFFFKAPAPVVVSTPASAPPARANAIDSGAMELALWESVKAATTVVELEAYLSSFPNGFFSRVAKARIAAMEAVSGKAKAEAALKASSEDASRLAAQRAEEERIAKETTLKAAQEAASGRAKAEAAQKASEEQTLRVAAQKVEEERVAKEASQKAEQEALYATAATKAKEEEQLALDQRHWKRMADGGTQAELESYLLNFPKGSFSAIARARLAAFNNPQVVTAVAPAKTTWKAGDVVGTLMLKDTLTGTVKSEKVTVIGANSGRTVLSTGDIFADGGIVAQVRVGDAVLRVESGSLWTIPLKANTAGSAKVRSIDANDSFAGTLDWVTVALDGGQVQVKADVRYQDQRAFAARYFNVGSWNADYRDREFLPESFSVKVRGTGAGAAGASLNMYSAVFTPQVRLADFSTSKVTDSALPTAKVAWKTGDLVGTLKVKDTFSGVVNNESVTVVAADASKIVFSSGDAVGKDGRSKNYQM